MSRYLLTGQNSKFIITCEVSNVLTDPPLLVNRYFIGNNVFESFRVNINVNTSEASVNIVNTTTGAIISTETLGNIFPVSSGSSSSSASSGIFDLMYSICGNELTLSGRDTTTASSEALTYNLNTSSFGTPLVFTNSLVGKVNQLQFTEEGLFGFTLRPLAGINPQCSQTPVFDQPGTFTVQDNEILIASVVLATIAFAIAIGLLIAFLVQMYPTTTTSSTTAAVTSEQTDIV